MKKPLLLFFILHSAFVISPFCRAQSGPVTKNPNTNQINEDLIFGSGRKLTIASGGSLVVRPGANMDGLTAQTIAVGTTTDWEPDAPISVALDQLYARKQASDATLSLLSGKTVSAFALSLLDDASAAAMRTTLGLGTAATANSTAFAKGWSDLPGASNGGTVTGLNQLTIAADDSPGRIIFQTYNDNARYYVSVPDNTKDGGNVSLKFPAESGSLALASRTITGAGLATGGGDITANRTITVTAASNAQATAGTATNVAMTPAATRAAIDARPTVALFTIPLGGQWTDFELKGSVSNFSEHTPFTEMFLYYHSPDPARSSITSQTGPKPSVWFTDSAWVDHRRWRKQTANQSIWTMRSAANAVISAVIAAVPVDSTVTPASAALVWSYCRISPTDYERDAAGRTIWHPIVPTWATAMPNP